MDAEIGEREARAGLLSIFLRKLNFVLISESSVGSQ